MSPPYQSIDGENGDSKSSEKLECLKLPADLTGMSVLDVGCREGFFCGAALERGAARVVGIDVDAAVIERARARFPGAEFIAASWWDTPAERFDYILFLSAIHYEPRPRQLLELLASRLKPTGTLILECGTVHDLQASTWHVVQRHDGEMKFPTFRLLTEELLSAYAVRDVGRSVNQAGDPVSRRVFHCTPALPTLFVIGGASHAGKTVFARQLSRRGIRVMHTDFWLGSLKRNDRRLKVPFVKYVGENLGDGVDVFVRKMMADKQEDEFCATILRYLSLSEELSVVEGYAFSQPSFREAMKRQGTAAGYRVVFAEV